MNKKKALGLLIGIGVTLAAVNIVADKATSILNKPEIPAADTVGSEPQEDIQEEAVKVTKNPEPVIMPDIPEGMIRMEVLVAKTRIGKEDIFSADNVERIERNFPENTEKSNLLVLSEDVSFEQALDKIRGFKPVNALRPQDLIYLSRVDFEQEQVTEEDLTRIGLSLDQRVRFSDAGQVTLIHLERSRSATGSEVVKIREALRNIPIVTDDSSGGAFLQFSSQSQRDFAQEILDAGGLIEIDMKTTAKVRRLSCGVETCMGTLSQFPELAPSFGSSVSESQAPAVQAVVPSVTSPAPVEPPQPDADQGGITIRSKPLTWAEKARLQREAQLQEQDTSN